jgi:hypothetical protein
MNIQDELGWLPRMIMGEREIDELVKQHPVPLNTDDHNVIEFTAPYDLVRQSHSNAATHFQKRVIRFGMRFEHYFTRDGVALSAIRSSAFWERVALTFLAYGKWQQVAPIIAKRAKLPLARRRTLLRLARLMQNKERAPTLPTYRDVPRHQRPLVKALWKARHLFFDDEEKASFAILKKLQKHKAFISNHPEVWFYLGACARHLEQYRASLGYYQRYLKGLHRKQQAKLHKTTRTRPFTTSQPTTRPASQPASRPTSRPNSRQVAQ